MFKRNSNKFLIFHLAAKNSLELKRFVSRSKNRDKARKELLLLKYHLSKLSPLLYHVVKVHSTMINNQFEYESSDYFRIDDSDHSTRWVEVYRFKCHRFKLISVRQEREWKNGRRIYVYEHDSKYGLTSISTSNLEEKIMKNLIAFNCENKKALDQFKKMKHELNIRNLVDV